MTDPNRNAIERRVRDVTVAYDERVRDGSAVRAELADWIYRMNKSLSDQALLHRAGVLDKRVLNIGCFLPRDEMIYLPYVKQWVSLDLAEQAVRVARNIVASTFAADIARRGVFLVGDGIRLPFADATFDITVSFSTIDHVPDAAARQEVVREMTRVTRPGGHVIVTVPNKLDLLYWFRSARAQRAGNCPYGYEHCFTPWELARLMRNAGLRPLAFASTNHNSFSLVSRLLSKLGIEWINLFRFLGYRVGYVATRGTPGA